MIFYLSAKIVDVETAFLYGDLEEEIIMDCPPGMFDAKPNEALLLGRCIYGLVQASRKYHKKMTDILQGIGFVGGIIDLCLFVRKSLADIVYIALYVDDNLMIGNPKAIDEVISFLRKNNLVLKIQDKLTEYI